MASSGSLDNSRAAVTSQRTTRHEPHPLLLKLPCCGSGVPQVLVSTLFCPWGTSLFICLPSAGEACPYGLKPPRWALTAALVQVHADELEVPLVRTPAAFRVGHVPALWTVAVGEAVAPQGHLCTREEQTNSESGVQGRVNQPMHKVHSPNGQGTFTVKNATQYAKVRSEKQPNKLFVSSHPKPTSPKEP